MVGWVLWHINLCSVRIDFDYTQLNVKPVLYLKIQFSVSTVSISKTDLFKAIQFSISTHFRYQKHFYFKLFNLVKVLIQTIQFSIDMQFSFIYPILIRCYHSGP